MNAAVDQVAGLTPKDVQDVIIGCAMPEAEQGLNMARTCVFVAGWPDSVPGVIVNRFCSSGLQAMAQGAQAIASGCLDVVVAGGVESMSAVPMSGNKVSLHPALVDRRIEAYISMGHTAERVAKRFGVSRADQDAFATASHAKAAQAIEAGWLKRQVTPVQARQFANGQMTTRVFDTDECPRPDTSPEGLGKLRPAFSAKGSVTAGNSSPLSDGAAASVLLSERKVKELGAKPLGYMRGFAVAGVPPDIMGIGPVPAITALCKQTGMSVQDIDLFEINEAFAAQALYCQRELQINPERLNVNGGAIALGHPLGCTGAKLAVAVLHELRRRNKRFGVVSMCIGGGMGAAGLFEAA
jgi:acetyl-CoA acyltransferase